MNKKVFLISLSVFSVFSAIITPKVYISSLPNAYTAQMEKISYTEYVNAIGEIVSADEVDIKTDIPVVIGRVCKQSGDRVVKGELLAEIDRQRSAENIIELGEYASLANLSENRISSDYPSILEIIPQGIYSDCDGIVSSISAKSGELIGANGTILTMSGTKPLSVETGISENKISKVNIGQRVIIGASAFGEKTYNGYVESIAESATKEYSASSSQTVIKVNIVIENADEFVKSGYTADVKICVSDEREINVVPYEAVVEHNDNSFVYIFENGVAKRRQITTGVETTKGIEILSGIASNDVLIYSDKELKNGEYVAIKTVE